MVGSVVDRYDCGDDSDLEHGAASILSTGGTTQEALFAITSGNSLENWTTSTPLTSAHSAKFSDVMECKIGVATAVTLIVGILQVSEHLFKCQCFDMFMWDINYLLLLCVHLVSRFSFDISIWRVD